MNKEIEELLPFYVNGTLEGDDYNRVVKALEENPAYGEEILLLQRLQTEMQALPSENSPGELGLRRLQNTLAREKTLSPKSTMTMPNKSQPVWRAMAIAACILLIVQTISILPQWMNDKDADLIAAGGSSVTVTHGTILAVTFIPDAREQHIRQLLLSINAQIVEGPSALGVYKISVPTKHEDAIGILQAQQELIESVQIDSQSELK